VNFAEAIDMFRQLLLNFVFGLLSFCVKFLFRLLVCFQCVGRAYVMLKFVECCKPNKKWVALFNQN